VEPTAVEATAVEPTAMEPTAMESTAMESTAMKSTAMESATSVEPPAAATVRGVSQVWLIEYGKAEQSGCDGSYSLSPALGAMFA
jgi:hypothetical protein